MAAESSLEVIVVVGSARWHGFTWTVDVALPSGFDVATVDYDAKLTTRRSTEVIYTIQTHEAGHLWAG